MSLLFTPPPADGRARPAPALTTAPHVIADDAEAIAVAHRLAAQFAPGAARRDRERLLPWDGPGGGTLRLNIKVDAGNVEVTR